MNVPDGVIELTVASVVGFVFKVVFGLIAKNEEKSDEADNRLQDEIKELREEMRAENERHRQHENNLFEKAADVREDVALMRGRLEKP